MGTQTAGWGGGPGFMVPTASHGSLTEQSMILLWSGRAGPFPSASLLLCSKHGHSGRGTIRKVSGLQASLDAFLLKAKLSFLAP